ncbi:MAG: (Fe-S)-binding protein [Promethearchaeota archaeon]
MTEALNNDKKKEPLSVDKEKLLKKIATAVNYCLNCNKCVISCPLSQLDLFYPRDLINDLNFLSLEVALEKNNIWQCLTCGQCMIYCPMTKDGEGVNIPELILELREISKNQVEQIERILRCETHDGMFTLISQIMANNPQPPDKLDFIEENNLRVKQIGDLAYFVGCLPLMKDVLYSSEIDYLGTSKTIISLLNENGIEPVVLNEKCCGHDILWGRGDVENFKKLAEYNVKLYKDAGVKTIIVSCAEGYRTWKFDYPKYVEECDFEVLYFAEYFLKTNILENVRFPQDQTIKVTYHDACRLGRLGGKVYEAPRKLIKQLPNVELVEMKNNRDEANCCGVSAFTGCNEYTRILRQDRINQANETGADYLLVPCPKCLTHFNCYLTEPGNPKEKKIEVMDLANFIGKLLLLS